MNGPGAPLLTSIVSEDGIYADFEVDEQTYLATIRDAAVGNAQESQIPVELATPGEAGRVYHGFIQNFDNKLDANSGTTARGPGSTTPTARSYPACSSPCGWPAAESAISWSSRTEPLASIKAINSSSSSRQRTK